MIKVILPLFILFNSSVCFGFDFLFQYNSFSEGLFLKAPEPQQVDSEYRSDILAYRAKYSDWLKIRNESVGFLWSIGSMSTEKFYNERLLFLKKDFSENFHFRLLFREFQDYESLSEFFTLELKYSLSESFHLGLFGEAEFDKSKDDFGFFIEWDLLNSMRSRLSVHWLDFDKNKKTFDQDKFDGRSSAVYALFFEDINSKDFQFETGVRYTPQIARIFEVTNTRRSYRELSLMFRGLKRSNLYDYEFSIQYDKRDRRLATTTTHTNYQFQKIESLFSMNRFSFFENWSTDIGLAFALRTDQQNQLFSQVTDFLPFINFTEKSDSNWKNSFGLEVTSRTSQGDEELLAEGGKKIAIQSRLNYFLIYQTAENLFLRLSFTFDLDEFGGGRSWEGGGGHLQMSF